jgi:hypothetical protein
MKNFIFWNITPCRPLKVNRRLAGTCRLHLQGRRISQASYLHIDLRVCLSLDWEKGVTETKLKANFASFYVYDLIHFCENIVNIPWLVKKTQQFYNKGRINILKSSIFWTITLYSPLKANQILQSTSFHVGFLLLLFSYPQDEGDMFLRNVGWILTGYMALYPRRQNSSERQ